MPKSKDAQVGYIKWLSTVALCIWRFHTHGEGRPTVLPSFPSVQFSCSVMSDSLRPHESQHARPPSPSPTPGVHPNPCPSSQWCHPAISSSVAPFSSCPQSLPASESFPISLRDGQKKLPFWFQIASHPMNIWYLTSVYNRPESFLHILLFSLHKNYGLLDGLIFTEEETLTQKSQLTCPVTQLEGGDPGIRIHTPPASQYRAVLFSTLWLLLWWESLPWRRKSV